ncbi:MAG TPA: hypothetical protein VFM48_08315 [Aquabacterium sp.]|nr:hypothetical protein [Aquabacterium sp.]
MTTIIAGQAASFQVIVQRDGAPVAIDQSSIVTAQLFSADGLTALSAAATLTANASWATGQVTVALSSTLTNVPTGDAMLVVTSTVPALVKRFSVSIESASYFERSTLFVKDIAVDRMRQDTLLLAAKGVLPDISVTDDFLWDKLRAAESEMSHELRVPLAPTAFFPDTPTADQIAALNGMPWGIDPGYEYDPVAFGYNDKWGLIKTRQKPIQSVSLVRFAYPGGETAHYDLPLDWLRMDKKYGTIQFVPSSSAFIAPLNAFVMQAIGAGRIIPLAIQLNYVAGLENAQQKYPELIDAIFKKAAIKIVEDLYLPQSGSISADGLSQSMSVDLEKYRDSVDRIINGEKGTNGGLMTAIHGVRMGMLGG